MVESCLKFRTCCTALRIEESIFFKELRMEAETDVVEHRSRLKTRKVPLQIFVCYQEDPLKDRCYTRSPKAAVFYILFDIFTTRPSFKNLRDVFLTKVHRC